MNRRRKQILFILASVVILILIWLIRPRPSRPTVSPQADISQITKLDDQPITSPLTTNPMAEIVLPAQQKPYVQSQIAETERKTQEYTSLWRTPITFFGKVIDESNQPVAGVRITYGANSVDEQLAKEERYEGAVTSDASGVFQISGIRGRAFVLELSHPNYYSSSSNRTGFAYADEMGLNHEIHASVENAMLFYMHHNGNPVELITRHGGLHKPADGTTMDFPLRGKTRSEIIGQLQMQGWKSDPDPEKGGQYDWKVRITVTGGGVLESKSEFDFVAPKAGYRQILEVGMAKNDPNWKPSMSKTVFFKLPNYFARGKVNIDMYHDFYFSMQYFVNPDGSANLENDSSRPFQEQ